MDRLPATEIGTSMAGLVPRKRVRVSDKAPVLLSTCSKPSASVTYCWPCIRVSNLAPGTQRCGA